MNSFSQFVGKVDMAIKSIECIEKKSCTGCGLCAVKCPKDAISMQYDREGFYVPVVNAEACIDCGICLKICPTTDAASPLYHQEERTYFCGTISDQDMLIKSSSGGVFGVLAEYIRKENGCVCGCVYDENMEPVHVLTDNRAQIEKMYGSKYVQSRSYQCFAEIKQKLDEGNKVLFTGTACQIAAIRLYLGKEYEHLFCVEILCHGVPSPKLFGLYVKYLEKKLHGKIENIQFRNKEKDGWGSEHKTCVIYTDKKGNVKKYRPLLPAYFSAFFYGVNLRESCYGCRFAQSERVADLTIGDFWGSWSKYHKRFDEGISVIGVNSEKGKQLLEAVKPQFAFYEKLTEKEAVKSNDNFEHPISRPPERNGFYSDLNRGYAGLWKKAYLTKTYRRKTMASIYGALVPKDIRYLRHRKKK